LWTNFCTSDTITNEIHQNFVHDSLLSLLMFVTFVCIVARVKDILPSRAVLFISLLTCNDYKTSHQDRESISKEREYLLKFGSRSFAGDGRREGIPTLKSAFQRG